MATVVATRAAHSHREGEFCLFFQKSEKLGLLCVAADTKSWSLASRKAANLLQHEAGEDDVDLYGGIAALRSANDQLFVSVEKLGLPNVREPPTTSRNSIRTMKSPQAPTP